MLTEVRMRSWVPKKGHVNNMILRNVSLCNMNTGIKSRRTSSSIFREEEVWLPHYMQSHPEANIFPDTPSPLPPLLPMYYHPNLFQEMISATLALPWLWQSLLCENRPYSVICPCCAHVDSIQILWSYMRTEIFVSDNLNCDKLLHYDTT